MSATPLRPTAFVTAVTVLWMSPVSLADGTDELEAAAAELDRTAWAADVASDPYGATITRFWDGLARAPDRLLALADLPFDTLSLPTASEDSDLPWDITRTVFANTTAWKSHDRDSWRRHLRSLSFDGWRVAHTSWHHTGFQAGTGDAPPSSTFAFELAASNAFLQTRAVLSGKLHIAWKPGTEPPQPGAISVTELEVLSRVGGSGFTPLLRIAPPPPLPGAHVSLSPVIVTDVDGDGLSEILNAGTNGMLTNRGADGFTSSRLFDYPVYLHRPGLFADFTGDAKPDFIGVTTDGELTLYDGADGIPFPQPSRDCWDGPVLDAASALTAGDIDGDGDLDLWVGQYKPPYLEGDVPSPFYDATDGFPSFLLLNDGAGNFRDHTVAAGLAFKHRRRTSSASLLDLDGDGDLDLVTVNDFAGIDAYLNDGRGTFTDATATHLRDRTMFGLGHTVADFDHDGRPDVFALGRSSVAADRAAALGLSGPEKYAEINRHRAAMSAGNRLFLNSGDGLAPVDISPAASKTGWPGDATALDFDNDGQLDLHISRGHITGKSSADYDSRFWRHDIYLGKSRPTPAHVDFFGARLHDVHTGKISWGGIQPDALALDTGAGDYIDAAFLMGVAHRFDSRTSIADDLDGDGQQDLVILHNNWADGRTTLHQRLSVHRNRLNNANHWLRIALHADVPGVHAIGSVVTAGFAGRTRTHHVVTGDGYRCQAPAVAHFGLGSANAVETVTVRWSDGRVSTLTNPSIDTTHVVKPPRR